MPLYQYKAMNKQGSEIKSELSADSLASAKQKAKQMGLMLIDIKEKKTKEKKGTSISFGQKVNITDLALMTRQLATLIKAKIQIVEALKALEDQSEHDFLKMVLSEVKQDVNEGLNLSKAMAKHPKVFSTVYVNMIEAGEASGNLEVVLLRLADFTEAQMKLKNKVQGAMLYPLIMMIAGSLLIGLIFVVVIPKIAKIFISMKMDLPLPTKIAINISQFLQSYWWSIPFIVMFLYWVFKKWKSTPKGQRKFDTFLLKAIIIGNLTRMINVSRFCSTLATLLNSGVPIMTALTIVRNLIPNLVLQEAIVKARENVQEGLSMTPPLKDSGHFPVMMTHMIALGEKSGELENMLKIVAENYEEQVNSKIDGLTSILEPIMIVFLGMTVFFVVISVIMPMMKLNQMR